MIEKRVSDKPVTFELSVGNAGNSLDGWSSAKPSSDEEDSDGESGECLEEEDEEEERMVGS